jgi:hypothetical protein
MVERGALLVACAACAVCAACNGILGNTPAHLYDDGGVADAAAVDGGGPPAALATARDCPSDLVVANGNVYFADQGSAQNSGMDGVIASIPAGGCAGDCVTTIASGEVSPSALVVNATAMWWSSVRIPTTDGAIRTFPFGGAPSTLFTQQYFPRSMAIDDTSIFWIDSGDAPPAATGEIHRAYLDGTSSAAIVTGLVSPVEITVRAGSIFWTNDGDSDVSGYVMTADITGSGSHRIASSQSHPRGIAVGATYVYWANTGDGTIMRARPDGTELTRLFSDRATPSNLAVDDVGIYWSEAGTPPDFSDGKLMAARLDGTAMRTIAPAQKNPRRVVLDTANVYWVARGTVGCTMHDGTIMRAGKVF